MADTVGIRFPSSGKIYSFSLDGMELRAGDRVVVESELGISIGTVARPAVAPRVEGDGLRPVLRKVTAADLKQEEENDEVKHEALLFCNERIATRGLDMKLITAEVTLDRKRFIFYFVSETRIDFRELVKDLASKLRARIELRQIGVRDAAKMVGGFGICGLEVCCKTWLRGFAPISIKMAKQQDLVLNTCKLSGLCGRLMCCLNYEYDEDAQRKRKKRGPEAPHEEPEVQPEPAAEVTAEVAAEVRAEEPRQAAAEPSCQPASREQEARRPEQPDQPVQPVHAGHEPGGSPFKKRRKRRRKGQPHGGQPQGGQPGTQQPAGQATGQESRPSHPPGAGSAEGPGGQELSRSKRRRMRRNRHKKPGSEPQGGQPHGGQPHGGQPHGGSSQGSSGQPQGE